MTTPPANFSAPVAAPVSTCLTIHLSAKHPRPYASQQVVIALSEYILCSLFSPHTIYTFLSSPQQRHSSGSALPLHLLPGGGANGQQGRQQHPRFLKKQLFFCQLSSFSGSGSDISRAATFGSASESSTPFISPQGTPIPFNRFVFQSNRFQASFLFQVSAQLCPREVVQEQVMA